MIFLTYEEQDKKFYVLLETFTCTYDACKRCYSIALTRFA